MSDARYLHLDVPTLERRPHEVHRPFERLYVSGAGTSPFGIQWTCYQDDAPYPDLVRTVPHVAFQVPDIGVAMHGRDVLVDPFSAGPGVTAAFVVNNGAPVKLLEFDSPDLAPEYEPACEAPAPSGLHYNSCWIPTDKQRAADRELHLDSLRMYVVPHDRGLFRIGWVRYQDDAPYPEIVTRVPHVAFEVDSIDQAIAGRKVIIRPNNPSPGLIVAFVEDSGAPVEFLQVDRAILAEGI